MPIFYRVLRGLLVAVLVAGGISIQGRAQDNEPARPVYIIQPGDTLSSVSAQFGVSIDDLVQVNLITNPNQLSVGDLLEIPGLEGIEGVLTSERLGYGESLTSLSRRYRIPVRMLARLNRVVSPAELFVGDWLILPVNQEGGAPNGRVVIKPGQTLLEHAVVSGRGVWELAGWNGLSGTVTSLTGAILFVPQGGVEGPGALPPAITGVAIRDVPLFQGQTVVITLETEEPLTARGVLTTADLRTQNPIRREFTFFADNNGRLVALQGVHAMAQPGLYPLEVSGELQDGSLFSFSQMVLVQAGGYVLDLPLQVDPKTLDPAVTGPEDRKWSAVTEPATGEKLWEGAFLSPSPFEDLWSSRYGSRRSYNGSPYNYFHTGLDFVGGVGVEIRAPAPGVVRFAEPMVVRGNATVIDHGWGVYTAYMHQSEILVEEGERVEAGQLIGLVGATGRVTGAHLHWEVWVGGIQVDPVAWLEQVYP